MNMRIVSTSVLAVVFSNFIAFQAGAYAQQVPTKIDPKVASPQPVTNKPSSLLSVIKAPKVNPKKGIASSLTSDGKIVLSTNTTSMSVTDRNKLPQSSSLKNVRAFNDAMRSAPDKNWDVGIKLFAVYASTAVHDGRRAVNFKVEVRGVSSTPVSEAEQPGLKVFLSGGNEKTWNSAAGYIGAFTPISHADGRITYEVFYPQVGTVDPVTGRRSPPSPPLSQIYVTPGSSVETLTLTARLTYKNNRIDRNNPFQDTLFDNDLRNNEVSVTFEVEPITQLSAD